MLRIHSFFLISGQSISVGAARPAPGAVHVLRPETPGIRRGLPLAGAVHRLNTICMNAFDTRSYVLELYK